MQTKTMRYCTGCMTRMDDAPRCSNPGCVWDESTQPETQEHLPRHYLLLDRYYIGRVLGQGGFGVTYIAQDIKLGRVVAIKEYLPKDQCSRRTDRATVHSYSGEKSEEFQFGKQRFLNEAQHVARLTGHPNIVAITDYAEANGTAYMVMEFIPGVTLKQYLASHGGKVPYGVAGELMLHVTSGLRKAHELGLVHRDVSPDNIMISSLGPIKLIDFGAARQAIGEKSQNLTMILKPGFAPEEQYRARGVQGAWTDVYAAAATLYRCITGHVPPAAPDRLAEDELVPPSKLCNGLPPAVEAVILKALAVRSPGRYQTMFEFQMALQQALHPTQPIIDPPIVPPPPTETVPQQPVTGVRPPPPPLILPQPNAVVLYNSRAVWIATFFGTALAGCIVLAINYRRLRNVGAAWTSILLGVGLTIAFFLWAYLGPSNDSTSSLETGIGVGLLVAMAGIAKSLQGKAVEENLARGGKSGSYWAAFGIGLLTLVILFGVLFLGAYSLHAMKASAASTTPSFPATTPAVQSTPTTETATSPPSSGNAFADFDKSAQSSPSGSSPADSTETSHSLAVEKGTLIYSDPITTQQATEFSKHIAAFFQKPADRVEMNSDSSQTNVYFIMNPTESLATSLRKTPPADILKMGQGIGGDVFLVLGRLPIDVAAVDPSGHVLNEVVSHNALVVTVTDSTGAAVPKASVTFLGDNYKLNSDTYASGKTAVTGLAAGTYSVEVQATGFKTYRTTDFDMAATGGFNLDVQLQVGQDSE